MHVARTHLFLVHVWVCHCRLLVGFQRLLFLLLAALRGLRLARLALVRQRRAPPAARPPARRLSSPPPQPSPSEPSPHPSARAGDGAQSLGARAQARAAGAAGGIGAHARARGAAVHVAQSERRGRRVVRARVSALNPRRQPARGRLRLLSRLHILWQKTKRSFLGTRRGDPGLMGLCW